MQLFNFTLSYSYPFSIIFRTKGLRNATSFDSLNPFSILSYHIQNKGIKECNWARGMGQAELTGTIIFRTKGLRNATPRADDSTLLSSVAIIFRTKGLRNATV